MYGISDLQKLVEMLSYLGIIGPGSYPAHSVVLGAGAHADPGAAGALLASNGPSADPSFQSLAALGIQTALGYTPAHAGSNSDITSLSGLTTPLSVAQGGLGIASLTAHAVLIGEGTSAPALASPGAAGNILGSNGASADPSFASPAAFGIAQIANSFTVVDSVAQISALSVPLNTRAFATGYAAAGDGGGGPYYYSAGSSATVNGGTVLSAAGGVGRWLMMKQTSVDVRQFGAKADNGGTDNGPPFNACAKWCWQNNVKMVIPSSGPGGYYGFATSFTDSAWGASGNLISSFTIESDPSAILRATASMGRLVDLSNVYKFGCKVSLGRLDANSLAQIAFAASQFQDSEITVGSAANASTGTGYAAYIYVPNSNPSNTTVFNNKFYFGLVNGSIYGIVIQSPTTGVFGVQGNMIGWGQIIANTQNGITIGQSGGDVTQYNSLNGGVVESNSVNGIIDYAGNNTLIFANTNSNGSNGVVVATGAKPDIVIGIVSDTYLDQTGASKSIIGGP